MVDYSSIPTDEQEGVLLSFWQMLAECEERAMEHDDILLKNWVEVWYRQWNRVTGDTKQPLWVRMANTHTGT